MEEDPVWQRNDYKDDPLETLYSIEQHFLWGIRSLAWSPDSSALAFAGQMNGDTSDLYLYDLGSHTITQPTVGIRQIEWLDWSPDGKWILHAASNNPVRTVEPLWNNYYAARPDGSEIIDLGMRGAGAGWSSSTTYMIYSFANVLGHYNLRNMNIQTGEETTLYQDSFFSYAIDPKDGSLAISGGGFDTPHGIEFDYSFCVHSLTNENICANIKA